MSAKRKSHDSARAKAALLQMLEDQLHSPKTPEVRAELARLVAAGVDEDEAKEMMTAILTMHVVRLMQGAAPFDYDLYLKELHRLPDGDLNMSQ